MLQEVQQEVWCLFIIAIRKHNLLNVEMILLNAVYLILLTFLILIKD
jgi:hypothetical protein